MTFLICFGLCSKILAQAFLKTNQAFYISGFEKKGNYYEEFRKQKDGKDR